MLCLQKGSCLLSSLLRPPPMMWSQPKFIFPVPLRHEFRGSALKLLYALEEPGFAFRSPEASVELRTWQCFRVRPIGHVRCQRLRAGWVSSCHSQYDRYELERKDNTYLWLCDTSPSTDPFPLRWTYYLNFTLLELILLHVWISRGAEFNLRPNLLFAHRVVS